MRTVKFRAWNNKENIMCYDNEDNSSDYWDGVIGSDVGIINSRLKVVEGYKGTYEYMQYIGINDEGNKPIYVGDIVRRSFDKNYEVIWDGWCFNLKGFYDPFYDYPTLAFSEGISLHVIGNVYENPGLLKGE